MPTGGNEDWPEIVTRNFSHFEAKLLNKQYRKK